MEKDDGFFDDLRALTNRAAGSSFSSPAHRVSHPDTDAVEITSETLGAPSSPKEEKIPPRDEARKENVEIRHFIPPFTEKNTAQTEKPELEYTPENPLIRSVKIFRWRSRYDYYESFCRDAERLKNMRVQSAEPVPFFSFVPQYSQMTPAQLRWYLFWREAFRRGECLKTDYGYLLLYLYEIINLSDRENAEENQKILCRVWSAYRTDYPQLDRILCDWICDFSLIHRLPPPVDSLTDILRDSVDGGGLKEFFIPREGEHPELLTGILISFCSNHDYRKSKYRTEENAALFDRIIPGALGAVIESFRPEGGLFANEKIAPCRLVRDAYVGALCSWRIRRRLEIEYCSFARSYELRYFIGDILKYAENKLRAHLGVKSRLGIYALPAKVTAVIDAYTASVLPPPPPKEKKKKIEEPAPYERFYTLPSTPLSPDAARKIEETSWETTDRLVEAFANPTEEKSVSPAPTPVPLPPAEEEPTLAAALGEEKTAFLRLAAANDTVGQRAFADAHGVMLDALAEQINEIANDVIGDILLIADGAGYAVIEDYIDLLPQE